MVPCDRLHRCCQSVPLIDPKFYSCGWKKCYALWESIHRLYSELHIYVHQTKTPISFKKSGKACKQQKLIRVPKCCHEWKILIVALTEIMSPYHNGAAT